MMPGVVRARGRGFSVIHPWIPVIVFMRADDTGMKLAGAHEAAQSVGTAGSPAIMEPQHAAFVSVRLAGGAVVEQAWLAVTSFSRLLRLPGGRGSLTCRRSAGYRQ
ncbi:hypothetical protein D3M70_15860 [Pseudomonas sp. LS-2]|nr:hypothetical protein D3M70_15860 [Pseudomonas sp. LS-2]